jgi:hypothetical protein
MPKLVGMAQLSRPFQIALLAFAVLVLAWFFVLHRPGTASTSSSTPSVSSSASSSSGSSSAGGQSSVYHGSVPGLEGLTKAIKRAHGAVAATQSNAQEVQSRAAQQPGEVSAASTSSAAAASRAGAVNAATSASAKHSARGSGVQRGARHVQRAKANSSHPAAATGATAASILHRLTAAVHLNVVLNLLNPALKARITGAEGVFIATMKSDLRPASQATVAAELKHHKTVLLLFLNPNSYDDDATAIETVDAAHAIGHTVVVHFALANQVNAFGSITRDIQVYQTPTLLIVPPNRQVTTLTGLTDAFTVKQAVNEARQ